MYLIVGLGNPEEEYAHTRHNMGFDTINKIAKEYHIEMKRKKFDAIYGDGMIEGKKVMLVKPQTYMNLSGKAIIQFIQFYHLELEDFLVVYDDMDVEPSQIKIRKKGGAGSHNGMKSVISELQSEEFSRIRVGIGKPERKEEMISYVIGSVPEEERSKLDEGTTKAAKAVIDVIVNGIDHTMNTFN